MTHPLLAQLAALRLPPADYALFGSGPLLARGWISDAGDLDVLARGAAWTEAQRHGHREHLGDWNVTVVQIGEITVGTRWAIGSPDTDRIIDDSELIEGIPCARLQDVVAYKRIANRPKDRLHLSIIERNLRTLA